MWINKDGESCKDHSEESEADPVDGSSLVLNAWLQLTARS